MPVIARHRAEEFNSAGVAHPRFAVAGAVQQGARDRVVHQVQRGVSADEQVLLRNAQKVREQLLCLRRSVQHAVIAAVKPADALAVRSRMQAVQHTRHHVQLPVARLSAGQIQFQPPCAERLILRLQAFPLCLQLLPTHPLIVFFRHGRTSPHKFGARRARQTLSFTIIPYLSGKSKRIFQYLQIFSQFACFRRLCGCILQDSRGSYAFQAIKRGKTQGTPERVPKPRNFSQPSANRTIHLDIFP